MLSSVLLLQMNCMMNITHVLYESPSMEAYEVLTEGVLCASPGNEIVGEEEGIGDFN